ncbi:MAG: hypothetical protein EOP56_16820 [Sphingobacteriales bacterium]|nr:MAG: hypothetical protein EOP56_16820 [Sphingobacteriales bacterium]
MKRNNLYIVFAFITLISVFASCNKKVEVPEPEEQELITTVKLNVTNAKGFNQSFSYRVENGFETPTPGLVTKDSLILDTNTSYNVEIQVLNEKENPAENITSEVIAEKDEHLFLYESNPTSGAGSIAITDGSKDNAGKPFNHTVGFKTTASGTGTMTVTLKHQPTDKAAATPAAAGGETDMQAVFNVRIR